MGEKRDKEIKDNAIEFANKLDYGEQFKRGILIGYVSGANYADSTQSDRDDVGEVSDGYHTFNELYHYRMLYNALWIDAMNDEDKKMYNVHKSKRHNDGELCFGGDWFIVSVTLPSGQVTNHYSMNDWDRFHCEERPTSDLWDGHSPQDAARRMEKFLENE